MAKEKLHLPQCVQSLVTVNDIGICEIFHFHIENITKHAATSLGPKCIPMKIVDMVALYYTKLYYNPSDHQVAVTCNRFY